jgi:hypothetical protein
MSMKPCDTLDILIDPDDLPNSVISQGLGARRSGRGNCLQSDTKLLSIFHLLTAWALGSGW